VKDIIFLETGGLVGARNHVQVEHQSMKFMKLTFNLWRFW